jgi:MinD superfamily P-loop ATPase
MVPVRMGETRRFDLDKLVFIESRLDIGEEQAVPLIAQTKKYVKDNFASYTYRIYDAPPGTSCPVIEAARSADLVILVTEPTPFGLNDLKLAVETIRQMGNPFGVVINRYGVGNDSVDRYCETEQIPVLARLPNDRRAAELYSRGQRIYTELPAFRSELEKVADYIKKLSGSKR